jgi:hypothetical protein
VPASRRAASGRPRVERPGAVLLRELLAIVAQHEGDMQIARRGQTEQTLQMNLPRRVVGEISPRTTSVMPCAASSTTTASW